MSGNSRLQSIIGPLNVYSLLALAGIVGPVASGSLGARPGHSAPGANTERG